MNLPPEVRAAVEATAMRRAVELAALGLGATSPNPVVGCVLLQADGSTVGEGWHRSAGQPHAEIEALAAAGGSARGATAVVTLEPCDHTGRTGPCSRALREAGVSRVVYGVADPTDAAGGARALRAAGIEVVPGVEARLAEQVNEAWLHSVRTGRPHVTWKLAVTLDGRSAAADGTSRWITGASARADVHLLRSRVDAVLVGVGTVLADDPQLTVRASSGDHEAPLRGRQPLRVVLDAQHRTPVGARVRDDAAGTLVLGASDVGPARSGRGVDLQSALQVLHGRGVRSVLLEGGPTVAGAMLDEGLVDRVVAYVAPALLGQGLHAVQTRLVGSTVDAVLRLDVDDVTRLGEDVRISGRPRPARPPS